MKCLLFFLVMLISLPLSAQTKVAVVKLLRGEVDVLTLGKTTKLKVDDWVEQGAVVRTAEKSFVKLVFIDKSQMNVGPNSEMKIETFSGKDSGVIDLVKGKIRSQVTKDYLQIQNKHKSKLFIKTGNAVMGVRGTDFMIATNGKATSTILFEGEVVFNRLSQRGPVSSARLEEIVDRGVRMFPGEFSVVEANRAMPTVPALLNIQQREHLEKNQEMSSSRSPDTAEDHSAGQKTVVPPGLNGDVVANNSDVLKREISTSADNAPKGPSSSDPEGYVKGDLVKPANGSFVHVDSGVIIPPGPSSVLDSNTNTYIPGQESGRVSPDGSYIPPKDVEITADGKVLVSVPSDKGGMKVQEVQKPVPVLRGSVALGKIGEVLQRNPSMLSPKKVITNDILNPAFAPSGLNDLSNDQLNRSGGLTGVSDPTRAPAKVDTTIIVKPDTNSGTVYSP